VRGILRPHQASFISQRWRWTAVPKLAPPIHPQLESAAEVDFRNSAQSVVFVPGSFEMTYARRDDYRIDENGLGPEFDHVILLWD
jgi:hypothetical protein